MPRKPKLVHALKMIFGVRDAEAAEGFYLEGMWSAEQGNEDAARELFRTAALLDKRFGGARYNFAALTEKRLGASPETIAAWKDYVACAADDSRQPAEIIEKVRRHIADLEAKTARG
ncbi:MAG: hypothetical protein SF028_04720 [Candidatus Sumerlaeia bacterium]|nr:hypothetical protein [Candidatus Sumerlaeia bacterium]